MPADIASLLSADEPTAAAQQKALVAALRQQSALGQLGQLTGDKVLGGIGQSLDGDARHTADQLAEVPQQRASLAAAHEKLASAQRENDALQNPATAKFLRSAFEASGMHVDDDVPTAALTTPAAEKLVQAHEAQQARKLQYQYLNDYRAQQADQKADKMYNSWAQALGNDLDAMRGRGGPLAEVQKRKLAADRLLTLIRNDDGTYRDLPPQQVGEAAQSLASILAGGGQGGHAEIERVVPKSLWGDVAGLTQYITNQPQGAGQQKFLKLMGETADRENALAQKQIHEAIAPRIAKAQQLLRARPDLALPILQANGIDTSLVDPQTGLLRPPVAAAVAPTQQPKAASIDPAAVAKYKAALNPGERLVFDGDGAAHALSPGEALPAGFTEVP